MNKQIKNKVTEAGGVSKKHQHQETVQSETPGTSVKHQETVQSGTPENRVKRQETMWNTRK